MADGDPLARHGSGDGGAAPEKRNRDGANTAEEDGLLLLLDGLSPSPAKKVSV